MMNAAESVGVVVSSGPLISEVRFAFPIVRLGHVCVTDRRLEPHESLVVARRIQDDWIAFRDASEAGWHRCSQNARVTWKRDETVTVSDEEITPIVHFPQLEISFDRYRSVSRMNLTVCAKGNNSKLWCRVALEAIDGRPAENLSLGDIREFFDAAIKACESVNEQMGQHYQRILFETKLANEFKNGYDILIRVVESPDVILEQLFGDIRCAQVADITQLLNHPVYVKALGGFFSLIPEPQDKHWEVQLSRDGAALYCSEVSGTSVKYIGLAHQVGENSGSATESGGIAARALGRQIAVQLSKRLAQDLGPIY